MEDTQQAPLIRRYRPSARAWGGYVVWEESSSPDVILIGTGSEVHIALEAGELLQDNGISARVVSLPSWEMFDAQPAEYRESVLPANVKARVAIEAATTLGWERYVGSEGVALGIDHFGASASQPSEWPRKRKLW